MQYKKHFSQQPADWVLYDVMVDAYGNGDFASIDEALNAAPDNDSHYVIYIRNGIYQERLDITRANVHLIGEHRDNTVILGSCANGLIRLDGKIPGTYGSRIVNVDACGFSATSLTIKNGFDYAANFTKADSDPSKIVHTQAVALLIGENGDKAEFKDVKLDSYHDTLYVSAGRSYFERCQIMGTVDFIFGGGTALFYHCDIISRYRVGSLPDEVMGIIAAPCTPISQQFGLVFDHCRLTKESQVPAASYALARPWHPTTQFDDVFYADPDAVGHCAYLNCEFDDHIAQWENMSGRDINGNIQWFKAEQSRFFETCNQQYGMQRQALTAHRLDFEQVSKYTHHDILNQWQPHLCFAPQLSVELQVCQPLMQFPLQLTFLDRLGQRVTFSSDQFGYACVPVHTLTLPIIVEAHDIHQDITIHTILANIPTQASPVELSLVTEVLTQQLVAQEFTKLKTLTHAPYIAKSVWDEVYHRTYVALRELT
ncbi:pectinesterase family protein [Vibrio alginolyticus]